MSKILSHTQHNITHITLNHPEKNNILSSELMVEFLEALSHAENNAEVKTIIINANGKHFCAGADLKNMHDMANAPFEKNLEDAKNLAQFFYRIYASKKIIVSCVHGKTLGGGLGIIAASDYVVSTPDALFCFPEVKLHLYPAVISPFVSQKADINAMNVYIQSAEFFSAKIALEAKLIDAIDDAPVQKAETLAKNITKKKNFITQTQLDQAAHQLATLRGADKAKRAISQFLLGKK